MMASRTGYSARSSGVDIACGGLQRKNTVMNVFSDGLKVLFMAPCAICDILGYLGRPPFADLERCKSFSSTVSDLPVQ